MISDEILRGYVADQITNATGTLNSDISTHRAKLYDRYLAEPYGDEVEGRSQVVMSDVSDTIEWMMPELMDIFTAGDDVAEFMPEGQEDEEAAKQETAIVNHVFHDMNNGFLILYTIFKDALMQKNAYTKAYWDERVSTEIEEYANLTPEELLLVLSQIGETADEMEILEQSEDGADIKVRYTKKSQKYVIEPVPPEELLVTPRWNSVDLNGAPFVAHKASKTVTDLIEMGFDRKQVESLPDDEEDMDQEEIERFSAHDNTEYSEDDEPDPSMREVTLFECYIYVDRDGDGKAELLQVYMGGHQNELMRWADGSPAVEEVSHQPFDCITPVIMPHKHFGRSIAELVEDLQRVRTVLVRQMLDNIYLGNNMRPHVDTSAMTDETLEDLLNTEVGFPVRGRGPGAGVTYTPVPNVTPAILQGIEYVDTLRENRSGVTKYNQGLDSNSLNKTATGVRSILTASQKKILLIARIFAETGVKALMLRIHRDLRKGPLKRIAAKLRNEWVAVNPRVWKDRTDMSVSVGLGTGDKDVLLMRLNAILERQIQGLEIGLSSREQILHTAHKMVEQSGFKAPELFFALHDVPQQPNPIEVAAQAEMAKEQMKAQASAQEAALKAQIEREKIDASAQKDAANIALQRSKLSVDAQVKDRELDIKETEAGIKTKDIHLRAAERGIREIEVDGEAQPMGDFKTGEDIVNASLGALSEQMAGVQDALRDGIEDMGREIAEGLAAPKEVVRENGKVVGVRSKPRPKRERRFESEISEALGSMGRSIADDMTREKRVIRDGGQIIGVE